MTMHPHRRRKAMQLHPRPPSIVLHLYDVVRTICSYSFVICFCIILSSFRFLNVTRTLTDLIMIFQIFFFKVFLTFCANEARLVVS